MLSIFHDPLNADSRLFFSSGGASKRYLQIIFRFLPTTASKMDSQGFVDFLCVCVGISGFLEAACRNRN